MKFAIGCRNEIVVVKGNDAGPAFLAEDIGRSSIKREAMDGLYLENRMRVIERAGIFAGMAKLDPVAGLVKAGLEILSCWIWQGEPLHPPVGCPVRYGFKPENPVSKNLGGRAVENDAGVLLLHERICVTRDSEGRCEIVRIACLHDAVGMGEIARIA